MGDAARLTLRRLSNAISPAISRLQTVGWAADGTHAVNGITEAINDGLPCDLHVD